MLSMMDAINMEHHRVHRTYSHKPNRTGTALPKRLWSLQSLTGAQHWRKIGPQPTDAEEKKASSKTEMKQHNSPYLTVDDNAGENPLAHRNSITEDNYNDNNGSISSIDENDQEHRRGLKRKAAIGLKRIITHFSLSDTNSLSETPGLTSTALHQCQKINTTTNDNTINDLNHRHSLLLSEETSLDTLSTVPDIMHDVQSPLELDCFEEKKNETPLESSSRAMRHHYRSQSYPTVTMSSSVVPDMTLLADRVLPPLPTDETKPSSSNLIIKKAMMNQVQVEQKFRQAVHWLGKPFHRLLSSPAIATMTSNSPNPSISPLKIHAEPLLLETSSDSLAADARTAAMLLSNRDSNEIHHHECNLGSPLAIQDDQGDLPWVRNSSRANGKMLDSHLRFNRKKVLRCRVVQITNIASSKDYQYELFLQMNDITQASQMGTMKKIAKGISAASPKESFSFPVHGGFSKMKTLISKMDLTTHSEPIPANEEEDQLSPSKSALPIVGSTHLLSGNRFEAFNGKGLSRYTLTKPLSGKNQKELQEMDLELMVAFQLEDAASPTHTYMSGLWTGELDFDAALASCHQGDYLTFYTWTRYWITLEHGQIYFRHLSYEHKESIDSIPLSELESVCKPWEDIQEQVYFGRKHGIVLKFKKDHVRLDQVNLEEDECLEGYMYLFADSPKKAALWRTVLSAYATADYVTPNASINARYLW
ncbi:hypothetical protein BCR42DRAFT_450379 [Absidia repens]|uniref:PH domain-containing protein n=1 Tax=Absidia repens TaxID=90262 RepID=A0A1X2IJU5_9FUNG|nr:hypothetical protein BCR42DRAFT_450379 [Absidia repens]